MRVSSSIVVVRGRRPAQFPGFFVFWPGIFRPDTKRIKVYEH